MRYHQKKYHGFYYRGYKYRLSRIIMEQHLGRALLPGEEVHHINGDTLDDRIENLQVLTKSQHSSITATMQTAEGNLGPDTWAEGTEERIYGKEHMAKMLAARYPWRA